MEDQSIYYSLGKGLPVNAWYDYLSNNLSHCGSGYKDRSLINRFLIVLTIPVCFYVYSVCVHVRNYPYLLYMKTYSSSDSMRIRPIRLSDCGVMVIEHVMENYKQIISSGESKVFEFTWNAEDGEFSRLISNSTVNNVLINSILLIEKNEELKKLRDNDQHSDLSFKLSRDDRVLTLEYIFKRDREDKNKALKHLLWIRDECQVIEQSNNDKHNLRCLSSSLESMILSIKSPSDGTEEERSYLTEPGSSREHHASHESNRMNASLMSWYDKLYMDTIHWGSRYAQDLGYWDNTNAIRNIIDPYTGFYVGRYEYLGDDI